MLCMPALPIIYWGTLANSEDPVDAAKCCMGLQCLLRLKNHSGTDIQGAFGKFQPIYKPCHLWYHFKELSFLFVIAQFP